MAISIKEKMFEPYSIVVEDNQYTVCIEKDYTDKTGKVIPMQGKATYHTTIGGAIERLCRVVISEKEDIKTLKDFVAEYKKIANEVSKSLTSSL